MWLVASAELTDLAVIRDGKPALWRELRRFNAPIQLAVAAAHEVAQRAVAPAEAAILSLAPCQSGSPELHRWVRDISSTSAIKVNPTHTLHAVDNLALSVVSIGLRNHAYGMSLGGSAGMAWSALELVLERADHEVIVVAGDQQSANTASPAIGVALLFARERTPHVMTGRPTRLAGIDRARRPSTPTPTTTPHAATGLMSLLVALDQSHGALAYTVPIADGDGVDDIAVRWEVA